MRRRVRGTSVALCVGALALWAPRLNAVAASVAAASGAPEWVWWEAEAARTSNFPANPFDPATPKATAALSGGKWIGAEHLKQPLFAEYDVVVRKSGSYDFYTRKFWRHGPFRWRFDGEDWRRSGPDLALLDDVSLAKFVNANWVRLGAVKLTAGRHVFRVEVEAGAHAVGFDCFLLIDGPFVPRGKLKPGEKSGTAPPGWFAFEPDADPFAASPLDLRWLNERTAGEGGFIQAKGDSFVHEKTGRPIRLWGVDIDRDVLQQDAVGLERFARRLAKSGVNLVRVHEPFWRDDDLGRVDDAKLNSLQRFVAALKRQGIYLSLSTYYPAWLRPNGQPGLEGYDGRLNPFGAAFFNPALQQLQKGWWRDILTAKNPYTGLTLLQDPTLAFLEIQNEDSLLFWTFSPYENVPAAQMEIVERAFGRWLATKYGSIARAFQTWAGQRMRGDSPAAGRAGVMSAGELAGKRDVRSRDTAVFLTDLQRRYYDQMRAYLKQQLGFRGAVTGSNWITADGDSLGPLDKWSNMGCDFLDRHGYFGGPHEGENASFLLSAGDRYNDASALRFETGKPGQTSGNPPGNLPILDLAYDGKPSMISEINWPPPNRFRAEMPLLAAAYGALQGTDAIVFFASDGEGWADHLTKFSVSDPSVLGQFPATALAFRTGLIRTGGVSQHREARLSKLFALEGAGLTAIDPLTYLTGRVEVAITDPPERPGGGDSSHVIDLSPFIDRQRKTVSSSTGELTWDYGRGLVTINAPSAAGATGFLSTAGSIKLGDVAFQSTLEYGSLLLVAMDGQPLASSRKMLLQVMSEDNNLGWSAPGKGLRPILDVGGPPLVVKRIEGTLSMNRRDAAALRVEPLDANGYPSSPGAPIRGARRLTLLPTTLYYLIEK